eukprot:TRINITY_DN15628_c0_g1_i1.p1 TRINITY_DN15628_c0_g1~~TRINITY_DN15628_c0_g1_i1.p1  ORF type:complete len:203 (-),score=23.98 TRINITY_DN15628_c0_g1_i1:8-616(-)
MDARVASTDQATRAPPSKAAVANMRLSAGYGGQSAASSHQTLRMSGSLQITSRDRNHHCYDSARAWSDVGDSLSASTSETSFTMSSEDDWITVPKERCRFCGEVHFRVPVPDKQSRNAIMTEIVRTQNTMASPEEVEQASRELVRQFGTWACERLQFMGLVSDGEPGRSPALTMQQSAARGTREGQQLETKAIDKSCYKLSL